MTAHNHSTFVEGCYRCELSKDEVTVSDRSAYLSRLYGDHRFAAERGRELEVEVEKEWERGYEQAWDECISLIESLWADAAECLEGYKARRQAVRR